MEISKNEMFFSKINLSHLVDPESRIMGKGALDISASPGKHKNGDIWVFQKVQILIYQCILNENVLGATPSAPGASILSRLPFGGLGAPFWEPFWHLRCTLGNLFDTSEPPWKTMGTAGWTRAGPEQDIH